LGKRQILLRALPPLARFDHGNKDMSTLIYWFRNDLRLHDNPAFSQAAANASALLPVYCLGSASASHNGDARWGAMQSSVHRQRVLCDSLLDLHAQLQSLGSGLTVFAQAPADILPRLAHTLGVQTIHCESIAATHEQAEIAALVNAGIDVVQTWQSSLLQPHQLPFALPELPAVFTVFRQTLEHHRCRPDTPSPAVAALPSLPSQAHGYGTVDLTRHAQQLPQGIADARSSLPYWQSGFAGGERAALAHLRRYFASDLPRHYKATRNGLRGVDFSSKLSGWLASGALSPRWVAAEIARYENRIGPNEGTPWLLQELLWRDYFRLLHLQHGAKLFRYRGLSGKTPVVHHTNATFTRWCLGRTGEPLVDAAMHELLATGYLSNRLRQVVASYLVYELACDWRAGAAWFEAPLIDYDVYNNQGNWLYIAGKGCDPRGGRHFNVDKQADTYDPDGRYRSLWQQP